MYINWNDPLAVLPGGGAGCKIMDVNGDVVIGVAGAPIEALACDLQTGLIEAVQYKEGVPFIDPERQAVATLAVFRLAPLTLVFDNGEILTAGRAPPDVVFGAQRSGLWPLVRRQHLELYPECLACGGRANLEVHHVRPYHLFPDEELNAGNLVTLCATPGRSCHHLFGHLLDWRSYNPSVYVHARLIRQAIADRPKANVLEVSMRCEVKQHNPFGG